MPTNTFLESIRNYFSKKQEEHFFLFFVGNVNNWSRVSTVSGVPFVFLKLPKMSYLRGTRDGLFRRERGGSREKKRGAGVSSENGKIYCNNMRKKVIYSKEWERDLSWRNSWFIERGKRWFILKRQMVLWDTRGFN